MNIRKYIQIVVEEQGIDPLKTTLFEMSNLAPHETGLPFTVFLSLGQETGKDLPHGPRVKVTIPPWNSHPEGVYTVDTLECVAGTDWLSTPQKRLLQAWVDLNRKVIIDYWNGVIQHDYELRAKSIPLSGAPPGNSLQAVATIRAIAPKVQVIRWYQGTYWLTFNRFTPNPEKIKTRFSRLGYEQPIEVGIADPRGILLWQAAK